MDKHSQEEKQSPPMWILLMAPQAGPKLNTKKKHRSSNSLSIRCDWKNNAETRKILHQ
ncbi:hypothetical protein LNQ49_05060 [Flavobacterium sp. F-65]|uniref:Uncharacterized protein n=1 Tax=Flavobacterium pisciphilum TaxID=2893755 RepID=A0ABS8MS76_9FLAO|nr:hypothetical protein [Flavobacterium sp. F-65]MCC9070967.1 hypothetical protein [Flavobacterium sp. F-65]